LGIVWVDEERKGFNLSQPMLKENLRWRFIKEVDRASVSIRKENEEPAKKHGLSGLTMRKMLKYLVVYTLLARELPGKHPNQADEDAETMAEVAVDEVVLLPRKKRAKENWHSVICTFAQYSIIICLQGCSEDLGEGGKEEYRTVC